MYLFTRAYNYILKQKAKSILLLVLFFVIGNIVLAGLSVQSAANTAANLTKAKLGTAITYRLNSQQIQMDQRNGVLARNVDTSTLEGVPTYANLLKIDLYRSLSPPSP